MRSTRPALLILLSVCLISVSSDAQECLQCDPGPVQLFNQAFLSMGGVQGAQVNDVRVEGTLALSDTQDVVSPTKLLGHYNTIGSSFSIVLIFGSRADFLQANTSVRTPELIRVNGRWSFLIRVETENCSLGDLWGNEHGKGDVFIDTATNLVAPIWYKAMQGIQITDRVAIESRSADSSTYSGFLTSTKITKYLRDQANPLFRVVPVQLSGGFHGDDFRS